MDNKGESRSVLVNVAAIIGACASLLAVLNQMGVVGSNSTSKLPYTPSSSSSSSDKIVIISQPTVNQEASAKNSEPVSSSSVIRSNSELVPSSAKSSTAQKSAGTSNSGILVAQDSKAQINIRDGPGLDTYNRHYGVVGDRVIVVASIPGNDGFTWYHVKFPVSGADGWVRGDFLRLDE